jgi:hypothetical protein
MNDVTRTSATSTTPINLVSPSPITGESHACSILITTW